MGVGLEGVVMNVVVVKSGKHNIVYIKESYRDEQGRARSRVVERLGILEELEKKEPGFLVRLKAKYQDERDKKKAELIVRANQFAAALNDTSSIGSVNAFPSLSYSMLLLRKIWNDNLNMNYKLKYLQKNTKYKFELADTIPFLTFLKMLDPASVKSSWESRCNYLGTEIEDCSIDNFYSTYDFLSDNKDAILEWINKRIDVCCSRSGNTMVFYDVTNVYFETSLSDEEKGLLKQYAKENVAELIAQGIEEGVIDNTELGCADENGNIIFEMLPDDIQAKIKELSYLRMRGMSKEHRYDLPLVSISLVIDENGFPIDFELYNGNTAEISKMQESISKMQEKYNVKNTVVVADRVLNSVSNLNMLQDNNYGFIVAQKVSNLPADITAQIIDENGYTEVVKDRYKYKIIDNFKKENADKSESVTCKLVVTFSQDRYNRDIAALNADLKIANAAVLNQSRIKTQSRQWKSLVVTDKKAPTVKSINQAAVEKRKSLCGYAATVYKAAPNDKVGLTPLQITGSYHSLVQIEDCFRVMKTNLSLRPMFVYTESHIRAHVLCCVMALIMLRLIAKKLDDHDNHLSMREIIVALNDCNCTVMRNQQKELLFIRSSNYLDLFKSNSKRFSTDEICSILDDKKYTSNQKKILDAFGIPEIPRISGSASFEKIFDRRFKSDEAIVGKVFYKLT